MEITFNLENINKAAGLLMEAFPANKIFAFKGSLGAGKTTIITRLCTLLGVDKGISSPTYSIINEYDSAKGPVYHMDLYRLKDENEVIDAGVENALYSENYCFVEWPEVAVAILPEDTIMVNIEILPDGLRRLRAEGIKQGN